MKVTHTNSIWVKVLKTVSQIQTKVNYTYLHVCIVHSGSTDDWQYNVAKNNNTQVKYKYLRNKLLSVHCLRYSLNYYFNHSLKNLMSISAVVLNIEIYIKKICISEDLYYCFACTLTGWLWEKQQLLLSEISLNSRRKNLKNWTPVICGMAVMCSHCPWDHMTTWKGRWFRLRAVDCRPVFIPRL